MSRFLSVALTTCSCLLLPAQPPTAPVVSPRGVVNAYTQAPAPSQVTAGGIIWINGLNLGPAEGAKATGLPLPTELAGVKVLINNREAPIFSVSLNRIEAQVPVEIGNGAATVTVRRGGDSSRPARVNVVALLPVLRSAGDTGFGEAAAKTSGENLTVFGSGFGLTDPRAATGDVPGEGAALVNQVRAYVGGLAAPATAVPSTTRPGEFEITITVPAAAQPGDLVNVVTANTAATPRRLYKAAAQAEMKFLPLPSGGAPDLRSLAGSDLRGAFAMAAGPRGDDGCYPAYRVDFSAMTFSMAEPCVTAGNRNQPNPFTSAQEGNAIAALLGPPEGELPNGVSSKLAIFSPAGADALKADLPATATNVNSQNGNFRVNLTSSSPAAVLVDADTAEVSPAPAGGGAGGGGFGGGGVVIPGGGAGGGFAALCLSPTLTVDLGDGVSKIVGCTQVGQSVVSVVVDSEDAPKKVRIATLNAQGQVLNSVDFPSGFLPVILPAIQIPAGGGGGGFPGGGGAGGGGALLNRIRTAVFVDANVAYIVSRATDSSRDALVAFASQQTSVIPVPAGWFAASCSTNLRIFTLDLARQIGFPATKTVEKDNKANCPAYGLMLFDRDSRRVSISESPGSEGFNAASQAGDVADFVYTVSTNLQRVNIAESLYVLDSTNSSSFRLDLPPGVIGFGQIREELTLFSLLAPANATANGNGDAGIAVFDLDSASARLLPTPDGYSAVQILSIFETTRKVVARGTKAGNTGSSILIYDLVSGDLYIPSAPAACAFAGTLPAAAGGPGGGGGGGGGAGQQAVNLTAINAKGNTVTVGCYDAARKLSGFLFIRSN